jgi:methyltransferase
VALVGIARLVELRVSRQHRRALLIRGGRAVPERGFAVMVVLHCGVLAGSLVEPLVTGRPPPLSVAIAAALGVVLANLLRVWSIRTLGRHWNVRVVDSTGFGVVESGPYRFVRHPNYVAVFLELLLLPVVQGAWLTAAFGSALHVAVLSRRIAVEEAVLFASPEYAAKMGDRPRFVPAFLFRSGVAQIGGSHE